MNVDCDVGKKVWSINYPILVLKPSTILTYLLTPWSRVLFETLTVSRLVKTSPALYGTRRFVTAFTSAHHLSLSCARSIHSILPIPLPEDPF